MYVLEVLFDERAPALKLFPGETLVGRDPNPGSTQPPYSVLASDPSVSRKHAIFRNNGLAEGCAVRDVGSSTGTTLNDERLEANKWYVIRDGDILNFGISGKSKFHVKRVDFVVSASGFRSPEENATLRRCVETLGGKILPELTEKEVTHLVLPDSVKIKSTSKLFLALAWRVPVVTLAYLVAAAEADLDKGWPSRRDYEARGGEDEADYSVRPDRVSLFSGLEFVLDASCSEELEGRVIRACGGTVVAASAASSGRPRFRVTGSSHPAPSVSAIMRSEGVAASSGLPVVTRQTLMKSLMGVRVLFDVEKRPARVPEAAAEPPPKPTTPAPEPRAPRQAPSKPASRLEPSETVLASQRPSTPVAPAQQVQPPPPPKKTRVPPPPEREDVAWISKKAKPTNAPQEAEEDGELPSAEVLVLPIMKRVSDPSTSPQVSPAGPDYKRFQKNRVFVMSNRPPLVSWSSSEAQVVRSEPTAEYLQERNELEQEEANNLELFYSGQRVKRGPAKRPGGSKR